MLAHQARFDFVFERLTKGKRLLAFPQVAVFLSAAVANLAYQVPILSLSQRKSTYCVEPCASHPLS